MMRDLFKKISAEPQQTSSVLRVIGDRSSGKTTYMASLARWPNADPSSPVQSVIPVGEAGQELINKAQNLLEQGLALEASNLDASAADVKDYSLRITLKGQFSWKNAKASVASQLINLNISCKDYAGEFFADLLQQAGNPKLGDYLDDCSQATGIMFLVDGNSRRKDIEYLAGLDKLLPLLDRADLVTGKRRISLVLTKCEQSELWVNRHKPAFLAEARFPQVYRKLQTWQQMGAGTVDYFTTSAFGMLGNTFPEPNVNLLSRGRDGIAAVIKDPKRWRPFGLVAPIYWLCTGDRHKELDKG
ncbi:hypothetical protein Ava_A0013 (plasmid) [Trichormus variabilis ATCC 29413]|uniref:Uncharacterized protein n=2 Tax=Anabaena variabilis TaxID=264691 RepID=Q3M1R5_TRIV2|nr:MULTISPECIES: hypothetical protein [Nostocaceae]ABA25071.1 hypothetical protein Ava_A0013 [Trichormus variabilis ATCC 29413]MBC1218131.1 hypothetical protein [Trichormus variabilis ARAD]MBC1259399.1 hypothetical protein [Trichormus variabilis V5]MBC1270906.1 hypothetical protein [Trichormus variabilis FSR]MBC1305826.1 hypothetical protein [Trichormus variabilis N2B]